MDGILLYENFELLNYRMVFDFYCILCLLKRLVFGKFKLFMILDWYFSN